MSVFAKCTRRGWSALFFLSAVVPMFAADDAAPMLVLSKSFPGSTPPYMELKIDRQGKVEYREGPDEENPILIDLGKADADQLYDLADRLGHFNRKLESGLPVAKMGEKTFRWEAGAASQEQKFNYTLDPDGQALQDWFERICESARLHIDLERTARFEKLGVNKALLALEVAWDHHRLVGLSQFLPLLDRIAKNSSYLNMDRDRAARLAETFRNPPPPKPKAGENGKAQ